MLTTRTGAVVGAILLVSGMAHAQSAELPTITGPVPVTETSHIFNGAAWQVEPIYLEEYGFVEEEFFVSGNANVYGLAEGDSYIPEVLRTGEYTTRITVRRPTDMSEFSGRVVVELINPSALYDWTAIWSALWERVVANGDVYVGITSKPAVFGGMIEFDPERYGSLSMANPLPPEEQECGIMPGEADFTPNLSKEYENGLIWDAVSQLSYLLRSDDPSNPLGTPARQVFLTGESQTGSYTFTYYRYIHELASEALGAPVYDGYLVEASGGVLGSPINQCATQITADDPRFDLPGRGVPLMTINSQWDAPANFGNPTPVVSNTLEDMKVHWELTGSNHGWRWQYLYGDADHDDLIAAGLLDGDSSWEAWECAPGRIEVPLYMAEKAMYEAMIDWIDNGVMPPTAPVLELNEEGEYIFDDDGIVLGGLRLPMVSVPVSDFGPGLATLSGDCPEMTRFSDERLVELYGDKETYLDKYQAATWSMVREGFLLSEDVPALMAWAEAVPFPAE